MWQRDWPAVHVALNAEWSEDVSDIMAALKGIYSKINWKSTEISLLAPINSRLFFFQIMFGKERLS